MALSSSSSWIGTGSRERQTHRQGPLGSEPWPGALCRRIVDMAGRLGGETGQERGAFWDEARPKSRTAPED